MAIIKITRDLPPVKDSLGILQPGDKRNDCCKDPANLEYYEFNEAAGCSALKCKKCGRRHFTLNAEAGKVGITGKNT
jgi:hypothetical protein